MNEIASLTDIQDKVNRTRALMCYFYNDDCSPCLAFRPRIIDLVEKRFPLMELFFIDSKSYPEIPAFYSIFSNPVILVFFEGREYLRKSIYISIDELSEQISRFYTLLFDQHS